MMRPEWPTNNLVSVHYKGNCGLKIREGCRVRSSVSPKYAYIGVSTINGVRIHEDFINPAGPHRRLGIISNVLL